MHCELLETIVRFQLLVSGVSKKLDPSVNHLRMTMESYPDRFEKFVQFLWISGLLRIELLLQQAKLITNYHPSPEATEWQANYGLRMKAKRAELIAKRKV